MASRLPSPGSQRPPGVMVVSLELGRSEELAWIERILDLFDEREIHATWACPSRSFAPDSSDAGLIQLICNRPGQELGVSLPGESCTTTQFERELEAVIAQASARGIALESVLFKSDAVTPELGSDCRSVLARHGILACRTDRSGWAFERSRIEWLAKLKRGLRSADNFSLLIPDAAITLDQVLGQPAGPLAIPSSRHLRGFEPRLRKLEPLRVHRLQSEMATAAEAGGLYHLTIRPQELAEHGYENMVFLDNLMRMAKALARRLGFRCLTMRELAATREA